MININMAKRNESEILNAFRLYQEKNVVNAGEFNVMSMNDALNKAKALPPLAVLYDNVVLEGDLCILFGQAGVGKTIFAMQVARDIAKKGKRVLYVDFEMTLRQLCIRYDYANFPCTFFRAEMDIDNPIDNVLKGIEEVSTVNFANVIFIDNITALGQSLDKGVEAGTLIASLNALKKKYGWTLILLNHVPKAYSGNSPLSLSSIQGSAKLNQLVDDAIGIGQSYKDKSLVYVKQVKWRNGELALHSDNVAIYERGKDEYGNLCFTFRGYGYEYEHLRQEDKSSRESMISKVQELYSAGKSQKQIADELGTTQSTISRFINKK